MRWSRGSKGRRERSGESNCPWRSAPRPAAHALHPSTQLQKEMPGATPPSSAGFCDDVIQCSVIQFSSVQSLSCVRPWSSLSLLSIELVMPSSHLILCRPLLFLPSIFLSIRDFSNESALHIRWPKYWSFSFNISPSIEYPGLISLRMD